VVEVVLPGSGVAALAQELAGKAIAKVYELDVLRWPRTRPTRTCMR